MNYSAIQPNAKTFPIERVDDAQRNEGIVVGCDEQLQFGHLLVDDKQWSCVT